MQFKTIYGKNGDAPSQLIDYVSFELKQEGFGEKSYDLQKALEIKSLETKANEVIHTGNTGYGAELVPGAIQTTDFIDLIPRLSGIIGALPGYHGRNLNKITEVPVIGKAPYHNLGAEWTTGAGAIAQGAGKNPTGKCTLTQKKYEFSFDISDEMQRFTNVVDVVSTLQRKLGLSAVNTQEALILNGDTATGATGNINSDDGTPASTSYYLGANGLRKLGLASGSDLGALTFDDYLTLLMNLGNNAASPSDVLFVMNQSTKIKSMGLSEFKDASINSRGSTIYSGALLNILGSDVFVSEHFGKTEADGKISTTAGNNTKGGILALHRNAVQYGYNGDYVIEIARIPGKGWQIFGYYYMGIEVIDKAGGDLDTLGLDPMVTLGYNVTL